LLKDKAYLRNPKVDFYHANDFEYIVPQFSKKDLKRIGRKHQNFEEIYDSLKLTNCKPKENNHDSSPLTSPNKQTKAEEEKEVATKGATKGEIERITPRSKGKLVKKKVTKELKTQIEVSGDLIKI
jgi:hypothetical protein